MNHALMLDQVNAEYVQRLRADGCNRCVRVRSRWIQTELRVPVRRRR